MAARSGSRIPLAVLLLLLILSSLVAVLVACPPAQTKLNETSEPAAERASPAGPESESPPETAAQKPRTQEPSVQVPPDRTPATQGPVAQKPATQEHPAREALISVVIDDAGYSLADLQPYLELPEPIAIAVLPHLPNSREAARRIRAAGKELLVHYPMEPEGGENPGPGALRVGQSAEEIEGLLAAAFESVPGAIGLNNHMGSKATADVELMTVVLGFLAREGKMFLDSRTTPDSVAAEVAERLSVPFLARDVFLDAGNTGPETMTGAEIAESFASGISKARARGSAVLIGHVQSEGVLDMLRRSAREGEGGSSGAHGGSGARTDSPGDLGGIPSDPTRAGFRFARLSELLE